MSYFNGSDFVLSLLHIMPSGKNVNPLISEKTQYCSLLYLFV